MANQHVQDRKIPLILCDTNVNFYELVTPDDSDFLIVRIVRGNYVHRDRNFEPIDIQPRYDIQIFNQARSQYHTYKVRKGYFDVRYFIKNFIGSSDLPVIGNLRNNADRPSITNEVVEAEESSVEDKEDLPKPIPTLTVSQQLSLQEGVITGLLAEIELVKDNESKC